MKKQSLSLFFILSISITIIKAQNYYCPPCNSSCDDIVHKAPGKCSHCNMTLEIRTESQQKLMIQLEKAKQLKVAIYLQNGVEILDMAGPIEVFAYAGMNVFTVSKNTNPIKSQGVLTIIPEYSIDDCPAADIVVFVGGNGANSARDPKVQKWLKGIAATTDQFFTVCTGAFFLAEAGLLKDQTVTTFHQSIENLRELAPNAEVLDEVRFVDNGKIVTTAGVSAGIDGALHLVHRMFGQELADHVAEYMEYDYWKPNRGLVKRP